MVINESLNGSLPVLLFSMKLRDDIIAVKARTWVSDVGFHLRPAGYLLCDLDKL